MSTRNLILLLAVLFSALYLVYLRTEFIRHNKEYGQALEEAKQLSQERANLVFEHSKYAEENRVAAIAEQMNMREPQDKEVIDVQ